MLVSFDKSLLFVKSAKTASSALELWFAHHLFGIGLNPAVVELDPFVDTRGIMTRAGNLRATEFEIRPHTTLSGARRLLGTLTFASLTTVTSIRNPYDQAVSFFWWRLGRTNPSLLHELKQASDKEKRKNFSEMIEQGLPEWIRLRHYVSLNLDSVDVDHLIRFERLEQDLEKISSLLFGSSPRVNLPVAKSQIRPSNSNYRSYYSKSDRRSVEEAMSWEIQRFGYLF